MFVGVHAADPEWSQAKPVNPLDDIDAWERTCSLHPESHPQCDGLCDIDPAKLGQPCPTLPYKWRSLQLALDHDDVYGTDTEREVRARVLAEELHAAYSFGGAGEHTQSAATHEARQTAQRIVALVGFADGARVVGVGNRAFMRLVLRGDYTPDQVLWVERLLKETDESLRLIAQAVGITISRARGIARALGVKPNDRRKMTTPKYSASYRKRLVAMVDEEGKSINGAARLLSINPGTAHRLYSRTKDRIEADAPVVAA